MGERLDDWKPGDLALCVRGGLIEHRAFNGVWCRHHGTSSPPVGSVHTVIALGPVTLRNGRPMSCGCLKATLAGGREALLIRLRKIRPHAPDAENIETIRLLNGQPIPAEA